MHKERQSQLAPHILPSSATMVGVCLTSISLVKLLEQHAGASHVDEYLALNSILFLVSAVCAYFSMRSRAELVLTIWLEKVADGLFVCGLIVMVIIATLFAYQGI